MSSAAAAPAAASSGGAASSGVSSSSQEALEGFTLLCKTSSGAQCVMVIQLVLKHPSIFVFGELLALDSVKQLATSEHRGWYDLLKLFAYGTYAEYLRTKSTAGLPDIGEAEITKLKQLTIVNMASKQRTLHYADLLSALSLPDVRSLENLIIECIYAGLLEGHLNQKDSTLEISSAMGRDIGPHDVEEMIEQLGAWLSSTDVVMSTLRGEIARVQSEEEARRVADGLLEEKKSKIMEELKANKLTSPMGAGGAGAANDEPTRKGKKSSSGKGSSGVLGMFRR